MRSKYDDDSAIKQQLLYDFRNVAGWIVQEGRGLQLPLLNGCSPENLSAGLQRLATNLSTTQNCVNVLRRDKIYDQLLISVSALEDWLHNRQEYDEFRTDERLRMSIRRLEVFHHHGWHWQCT